ncbi:MAG TPA: hypothetical protein DCZ72_15850 [Armatimonadetes bacterium]|nr:hypothetical protein [Armatimonadota bacterium]
MRVPHAHGSTRPRLLAGGFSVGLTVRSRSIRLADGPLPPRARAGSLCMDIKAEIIRIIAGYKEVDPSEVKPESTFEDLGIDSLDAIDIMFEIEEKLGLQIPPDALDLNTARSVADILEVTDRLTAELGDQLDLAPEPTAADADKDKDQD